MTVRSIATGSIVRIRMNSRIWIWIVSIIISVIISIIAAVAVAAVTRHRRQMTAGSAEGSRRMERWTVVIISSISITVTHATNNYASMRTINHTHTPLDRHTQFGS